MQGCDAHTVHEAEAGDQPCDACMREHAQHADLALD
jgi:hypothetical protein